MTREEAETEINRLIDSDYSTFLKVQDLIEVIYLDFESRTCESCDTCKYKPKEGEHYKEECGSCSYFYASSWEKK